MKLFFKAKDGGPESNVTGYWLIESKKYFSIALLEFSYGTRENFHSHAFNAVSWVLSGLLFEELPYPARGNLYFSSIKPIYTKRETLHRVHGAVKSTWVISFRGPWSSTWREYNNRTGFTTLTNGRKVVDEHSYNRQSPL